MTATISSLIYLSPGNLPSQTAHTGQIAKMSQAFAQKVPSFELVISSDLRSIWTDLDQEFRQWYSLSQPFQLTRLPIHLKPHHPFPQDYKSRPFYKLASLYAYLKAPNVIYTRTGTIARFLLNIGASVIWEWHEHLGTAFQDIAHHPHLLGLVTTLPQLADSYIQDGVDPAKICIAPNATDLNTFLPHRSPTEARQQLNLPLEQPIVVYSGHLQDYKGIPTILEVAQQMPEVLFLLVGGWLEDVERVRTLCRDRQLDNVQVIGHVPQNQLAPYLYAADVLLLPTSQTWELANTTCPLKLFDYMSVQKPIVASALPTIQTILRHEANALLATPDHPAAFQQAIAALIQNSEFAQTLAQRAYQDVQQYTWEKRADRILAFAAQRLAVQHPNPVPAVKKLSRSLRLLSAQTL